MYCRSLKSLRSVCVLFLLPFAFHYHCNYRARALCIFITVFIIVRVFITVAITMRVHYAFAFSAVFFTPSPAAVAENAQLQVVTMFEGRVCRAALGSGWLPNSPWVAARLQSIGPWIGEASYSRSSPSRRLTA